MPPKSGGGHKRTTSKTDFILPPDHEERERKRNSLQRQNSSAGITTTASGGPLGSTRQRQGSGHRRHDSLAFSFRGHSRQASRTDSIYTLRSHANTNKTTCQDKLWVLWNRCSRKKAATSIDGGLVLGAAGGSTSERRVRTIGMLNQ
jgi:hypothetical protein